MDKYVFGVRVKKLYSRNAPTHAHIMCVIGYERWDQLYRKLIVQKNPKLDRLMS